MKVMIDTNIILDVLLDREPFAENSSKILTLCEKNILNGIISASSITDIFYIVRKYLHSTEETYNVIDQILKIVNICDVTELNVKKAFSEHSKDFEDCLLAVCAKSNQCSCIITRNKKDYLDFDILTYTPDEYLVINNL